MDPTPFTNMVIRPPKSTYPFLNQFDYKYIQGKKYSVSSFIVKNENGNILSCSFVEPFSDTDRTGDYMPCVVYGHGNAGNKLEGL